MCRLGELPTGDSLLGYATFPGAPSAVDGVVITHTAFGTNGSATAPFNLGRTTTHEVGHWLNLRHIRGDDGHGCNGSDGDMFTNYMDYVDDVAMFMFTEGQVRRMHATLDRARPTIGVPVEP
nr:hypothetical protein [Streptomyces sp. TLI_235]